MHMGCVQGMYKSKLECPKCSHVGVKFDPYMYLSLNLPESKRRTLQVTALYVDGSQPPLQHAVDVPKTGTCTPGVLIPSTLICHLICCCLLPVSSSHNSVPAAVHM